MTTASKFWNDSLISTRETETTIEVTSQDGSCKTVRQTVKLLTGVH